MYDKNLTECLRLRLSKNDLDFLRSLSSQRSVTVSECIRSMIGEYRRSLDILDVLKNSLNVKGDTFNGDTETNIND